VYKNETWGSTGSAFSMGLKVMCKLTAFAAICHNYEVNTEVSIVIV
jgi:hypothetical protein